MLESNLFLHSKRSTMGHSLKSCLKREIINENKIPYLWTLIKSTAGVDLLYSNLTLNFSFPNQEILLLTQKKAPVKVVLMGFSPDQRTLGSGSASVTESHWGKWKCSQVEMQSLLLVVPMKSSVRGVTAPNQPGLSWELQGFNTSFSPERWRWKLSVPILFSWMQKLKILNEVYKACTKPSL